MPQSRIDEAVRRILQASSWSCGCSRMRSPIRAMIAKSARRVPEVSRERQPKRSRCSGTSARCSRSRSRRACSSPVRRADNFCRSTEGGRTPGRAPRRDVPEEREDAARRDSGDQVGAIERDVRARLDVHRQVDIAAAAAAAQAPTSRSSALGEGASTETPGNIDDLTMPAAQVRLARAIEATGTPVVLALFDGRPRIVRDASTARAPSSPATRRARTAARRWRTCCSAT